MGIMLYLLLSVLLVYIIIIVIVVYAVFIMSDVVCYCQCCYTDVPLQMDKWISLSAALWQVGFSTSRPKYDLRASPIAIAIPVPIPILIAESRIDIHPLRSEEMQ